MDICEEIPATVDTEPADDPFLDNNDLWSDEEELQQSSEGPMSIVTQLNSYASVNHPKQPSADSSIEYGADDEPATDEEESRMEFWPAVEHAVWLQV